MSRRIVVTRPAAQAAAWMAALQAAGHTPIALPLIDIRAVVASAVSATSSAVSFTDPISPTSALSVQHACQGFAQGRYQACMWVSANAVDYFFANPGASSSAVLAPAQPCRHWVTGPGTRSALLRCKVDAGAIDSPAAHGGQWDSPALWRVVAPQVQPGVHVLLVRGAQAAGDLVGHAAELLPTALPALQGAGSDWLAQQLRQAGAQVEELVVYERGLPVWDAATCAQAQALAQPAAGEAAPLWLLSSAQAVVHLRALLPGQNWQQAHALATHPRIAQAAHNAGFARVHTVRPALAEVLASIECLA